MKQAAQMACSVLVGVFVGGALLQLSGSLAVVLVFTFLATMPFDELAWP